MATKNPITGDLIKTKVATKQYEDNFDLIFKPNYGIITLLDGTVIEKCSRRCWVEESNNKVKCDKPNCERNYD